MGRRITASYTGGMAARGQKPACIRTLDLQEVVGDKSSLLRVEIGVFGLLETEMISRWPIQRSDSAGCGHFAACRNQSIRLTVFRAKATIQAKINPLLSVRSGLSYRTLIDRSPVHSPAQASCQDQQSEYRRV